MLAGDACIIDKVGVVCGPHQTHSRTPRLVELPSLMTYFCIFAEPRNPFAQFFARRMSGSILYGYRFTRHLDYVVTSRGNIDNTTNNVVR
jgi:hypothetical protein